MAVQVGARIYDPELGWVTVVSQGRTREDDGTTRWNLRTDSGRQLSNVSERGPVLRKLAFPNQPPGTLPDLGPAQSGNAARGMPGPSAPQPTAGPSFARQAPTPAAGQRAPTPPTPPSGPASGSQDEIVQALLRGALSPEEAMAALGRMGVPVAQAKSTVDAVIRSPAYKPAGTYGAAPGTVWSDRPGPWPAAAPGGTTAPAPAGTVPLPEGVQGPVGTASAPTAPFVFGGGATRGAGASGSFPTPSTPSTGPVPIAQPTQRAAPTDFIDAALPLLEELFPSEARGAAYGGFLGSRAGGAGGAYRNFLEGQEGRAFNQFLLNALTSPTGGQGGFQGFLSGLQPNQFGDITQGRGNVQGQLGQIAGFLRPGADLSGLSNEQSGMLEDLRGDARGQFNLALNPALAALSPYARGGFGKLAGRRFDETLVSQGQDPGFEYLPFLQGRGFRI